MTSRKSVIVRTSWPHKKRLPSEWKTFPGFFRRSWHIDRYGLQAECSLNTPEGKSEWQNYVPPRPAQEILLNGDHTKYEQPDQGFVWTGVVLATQGRCSIINNITPSKTSKEYFQFVEDACERFGQDLLIKMHPMGSPDSEKFHRKVAERHNIRCGRFNDSVFDDAAFVLTFNSSVALHAFARGVNVMQYAPGTFSHTDAVTYTDWRLKSCCEDRIYMAQKLLDFCVWRYCFSTEWPQEVTEEIRELYEGTDSLYPLPERLSYGGHHTRKEA